MFFKGDATPLLLKAKGNGPEDGGEPREFGKRYMYKGTFKADGMDGNPVRVFYQSGGLSFHGKYKQGLQDGPGTEFFESGMVRCEGEYRQGKRWCRFFCAKG